MRSSAPAFEAVVVGGDIGAYSLARHLHAGFGVHASVVSAQSSGLMSRSRILDHVVEPGLGDADVLVERLRALAPDDGVQRLLLASADRLVATLVARRDELEDRYVLPYVPQPLLRRMTDKASFSEVCTELGIPHPVTVVADLATDAEPDTSRLTFPVFAKAASTVAYHAVSFAGKRKGFVVPTRADLLDLLARVRAAGYRDAFVVQDLIPGDDAGMRILTSYADRASRVRYASFGHVLLEEHAPSAIGNPAAILTDRDEVVADHARRLLEHVGWTGWANFDLKLDPRTGESVFFELNPRLGRSNFYVAAGQLNPVLPYVRELLQGEDPFPEGSDEQAVPGHLFTVLPRPLLLRYLHDADLRAQVKAAYRGGHVHNPLWYTAERDPRRLAYLVASFANQFRKFHRHYPLATARARLGATSPSGATA